MHNADDLINMKSINIMIYEVFSNLIIEHITPFREVKHFHPNSQPYPNGCHYQRGWYLSECRNNKNSFVLTEEESILQDRKSKDKGGFIVFSTGVSISVGNVLDKIMRIFNSSKEYNNVAFRVGHHFLGKYIGDNGAMYSSLSVSIKVDGLSRMSLLKLADSLCRELMLKSIMVKDLNFNKIYIA